nr:MAG TPA: hypothetical protein [Caudoviricetes sp.]DAS73919.1 MAG TPA: hypothetical protein [Caudoviricetes sp.]
MVSCLLLSIFWSEYYSNQDFFVSLDILLS